MNTVLYVLIGGCVVAGIYLAVLLIDALDDEPLDWED